MRKDATTVLLTTPSIIQNTDKMLDIPKTAQSFSNCIFVEPKLVKIP